MIVYWLLGIAAALGLGFLGGYYRGKAIERENRLWLKRRLRINRLKPPPGGSGIQLRG